MATRTAVINWNGRIHDHDTISSDEEEPYNFSKSITLDVGGLSQKHEPSKTVDDEITHRGTLTLNVDANNVLRVSRTLEMLEDNTVEGSSPIDMTEIFPDTTKKLFDARLENGEGDWVTILLEVRNAP